MAEDLIRRRKKRGYTIIDNQPINDSNLKYEDIGLLVYVLSKPDDWVIYKKELISSHQNGRESVAGILKRLEAQGYLQIISHRSTKGRFAYNEYVFTDVAWNFEDEPEEPLSDQQFNREREAVYGKPLTGNRIRETVDGNPTPNNTIYTKLEEEEEKENEIENIHETKHISEIKPDQNNNSNPDQEILVFQNYTGIDLKGDGRKSTYQKWRTEWGFSQEMIMKAAELTCQLAKIPNLQYIDKILDGWMAAEIRTIEAADLAIKRFKDLKHERKGLGVNKKPSKNESLYSEFKLYVPPEEIDALKRKEV